MSKLVQKAIEEHRESLRKTMMIIFEEVLRPIVDKNFYSIEWDCGIVWIKDINGTDVDKEEWDRIDNLLFKDTWEVLRYAHNALWEVTSSKLSRGSYSCNTGLVYNKNVSRETFLK